LEQTVQQQQAWNHDIIVLIILILTIEPHTNPEIHIGAMAFWIRPLPFRQKHSRQPQHQAISTKK
jgi:hypothetical protein